MCVCLPVVWGCWAPTSSFPESCRHSRSSLQREREQTEKKKNLREFSTFPLNTIPLCFSPRLLKCNKWWITFPAACTEAWLLFQIKYKWTLQFKRVLRCISAIGASCFTSSAEYFNTYWVWMGKRDNRGTKTTWKMRWDVTSGAGATAPAAASQSRGSSRPRGRRWLLLTG